MSSSTFSEYKIETPLHLLADGSSHGHGEQPDGASAQVFSFPLLTEQTQLLFLILIQRVAVLRLREAQARSR